MAKIKRITAREVLNSKGQLTIEATVTLSDNTFASAATPGRTSAGGFEAAELIDNDPSRYQGMGMLKAVDNIANQIGPKLVGMDIDKQREIDKIMIDLDGTQNKSRLGSNSILAVSMACVKAGALSSKLPLYLYLRQFTGKSAGLKIPTPCFNMFNGGKIAGGNLDFQSFLLIPASTKPYSDSLQIGVNIYSLLKKGLMYKNLPSLTGDEGGFSPSFPTNEEALSLLMQTAETTSLRLGFDIFTGIDAAANNFYSDKKYKIKDDIMQLSSNEISNYYEGLCKKYNIIYLEDPLEEDDWDGWSQICAKLSRNALIVGDHITSTNPYRLQTAIDKKAITGITIKPSQIGTVIESLAVVEVARQTGLKIIVASTSAETTDSFLSDFSVAVSADYVKFGAPARGENAIKYNRLLEIETQLKTI